MQVFMQVLNSELGGDAAKTANKAGTLIAADGDGAFAAFLENTEENTEGEGLGAPDAEVAEDSDAKRQIVSLDSREKGTVLARQSLIGGQSQSDVPPPSKVSDEILDGDFKPPVQAQKAPEQGGLSNVDTKPAPVPQPSEIEKTVTPRQEPGHVKPADEPQILAKGPAGKSIAPPLVETPSVDIRVAPKLSKDTAVLPVVAKEKAALGFEVSKEGRKGEDAIRRLPVEELDTAAKKEQVERPTSETPIVKKPAKAPTPVAVSLVPKDIGPQLGAPSAPHAKPAAPAVAPLEQASEAAVKTVAARPLALVDKSAQPRQSRTAQRETVAEVTITTPGKQSTAASSQTSTPEPTFAAQSTLLPHDPVASAAQFGRDAPVARDEGQIQLSAIENTDTRRTAEISSPRVETSARPVITQLVQAAKSAIDGMIEVKLSPEELGRVRMAMSSGEAGMTVTITAERAETLDLIRRNIDLLAADLTEQGFGDLNFSFGQEGKTEQQDDFADHSAEDGPSIVQNLRAEGGVIAADAPDGRLDIRL